MAKPLRELDLKNIEDCLSLVADGIQNTQKLTKLIPKLLAEIRRLKGSSDAPTENYQHNILKNLGLEEEFFSYGPSLVGSLSKSLVCARTQVDNYRQALYEIASKGCDMYGLFEFSGESTHTGKSTSGCKVCRSCKALNTLTKPSSSALIEFTSETEVESGPRP